MNESLIETRIAKIWLDQEGIVQAEFLPGVEVTLDDARELTLALNSLCQGKKRPFLSDSRLLKSMDRDARIYWQTEEAVKMIKATAVLSSPIIRVLGALYTNLNKPSLELGYFSSKSEALEWLRGFLKES